MTSIDPTNQLAALIRGQVKTLRQRQAATKGTRTPVRSGSAAPTTDLATLVAARIGLIDPDDTQKERKALRIFLETVLLSELGQELVTDPAFAQMVDHVQQQMESDPELAHASREAAQLLLKSARR